MHRRQKRGEERGIGRTPNRKAGEKQSIHGEERQVGDHAKRCGAGRELGGASVPPPKTLVKRNERSCEAGDDVKLPSADECDRRCKDEQRSEERRVGKECRSRWWPYH